MNDLGNRSIRYRFAEFELADKHKMLDRYIDVDDGRLKTCC